MNSISNDWGFADIVDICQTDGGGAHRLSEIIRELCQPISFFWIIE